MRVSGSTLQAHRRAILDAAGALFRARGVDGVSIGEVTRSAGLTHGAFYGHFASKAALAGATCRDNLASGADAWRARAAAAEAAGNDGVHAIIDAYLTEQHRDAPAGGCALVALGPELSRAEPASRAALAEGVEALAAALAEALALRRPALHDDACRETAMAVLAALVGGMVVARALPDPARSRAALDAASRAARAAARPTADA